MAPMPLVVLRLALTLADWRSKLAAPTTSLKWEQFLMTFLDIFDLYVPKESRELMSRRRVALAKGAHSSAEY